MSWQAYVDSNIMGTNKFAAAVIIGHDGNTWAVSKNFSVRARTAAAIRRGKAGYADRYSSLALQFGRSFRRSPRTRVPPW